MRKFCLFCVVFGVLASSARTEENHGDKSREMANYLQQELTNCVAFYRTMQDCLEPSDPLFGEYDKLNNNLFDVMIDAGKRAGMSSDAIVARYQTQLAEMGKSAGNKCGQIADLGERHMQRCKQVTTDPQSIAAEFLRR